MLPVDAGCWYFEYFETIVFLLLQIIPKESARFQSCAHQVQHEPITINRIGVDCKSQGHCGTKQDPIQREFIVQLDLLDS